MTTFTIKTDSGFNTNTAFALSNPKTTLNSPIAWIVENTVTGEHQNWYGTGFTYDVNNHITGGSATALEIYDAVNAVQTTVQFSTPWDFATQGVPSSYAALLAGNDLIVGGAGNDVLGANGISTTGTVSWTDWTTKSSNVVSGNIVIGTANVEVTFSGSYSFAQVGGGQNYWNPSTPYLSNTVSNAPPTSDIIALNSGGTKTITFSQSVHNPVIALVSWNGNSVDFGVPIHVLSYGRGYWGSGTPIVNQAGTGFYGNGEVHGVIELMGDYTSVAFTDSSESWHGLTIGAFELSNTSTGKDTFTGGQGNDTYFVDSAGDNVMENKDEGTDTVNSSITYTLTANVENLTLTGTSAIDGMGNSADNIIIGNQANNILDGDSYLETLSFGNDTLIGAGGNDKLYGRLGDDSLDGGDSNDQLYGGLGSDTLIGGLGNDTLMSSAGKDTLNGSDGNDVLNGGAGNDSLNGDTGRDVLVGGKGDDFENGGAGYDVLWGISGNNTLDGGIGNDRLIAGKGYNVLTGGDGMDSFRFSSASHSTINDFVVADDTIKLENSFFTKLTTIGTLDTASFKIGTAAADADDYVIYNPVTGAISYDADGNGAAAAVKIVMLGVDLALTSSDFVVI